MPRGVSTGPGTGTSGPAEASQTESKRHQKQQRKRGKTAGPMEAIPLEPSNTSIGRTMLDHLLDMPLDILLEISGLLQPLDLLHLSKTTKGMRRLLMSRSSSLIWKAARRNVPGELPECPQDLSEPQYANLLFVESCHFCGKPSTAISWEARLRICKKCIPQHFRAENSSVYKKRLRSLQPFLPSLVVTKDRRDCVVYYNKLEQLWKTEYEAAADKSGWLGRLVKERRAIDDHAEACKAWHKRWLTFLENEQVRVFQGRIAQVVEHVKKLGWEEELTRLHGGYPRPHDMEVVLKACQEEVTEEVLSGLDEFIASYMQEMKHLRLARERKAILNKRLPKLTHIYQQYVSSLPPRALYPSVEELLLHPAVADIIFNTPSTVSEIDYDLISALFPEISQSWLQNAQNQLVELVMKSVPTDDISPDNVLDLATVWFDCPCSISRGQESLVNSRYPEILTHRCSGPSHSSMTKPKPTNLQGAALAWFSERNVSLAMEDFELMTALLKSVSLDPKTATLADVDQIDPIFECYDCSNVYDGRFTMRWYGVRMHKREKHKREKMTFRLLNNHDAAIVKARLLETEQRHFSQRNFRGLRCLICDLVGNMPDLLNHVKDEHHKCEATIEDLKILQDPYFRPQTFALWPPRSGDHNDGLSERTISV